VLGASDKIKPYLIKGFSLLTDGNWTISRETSNKSGAELTTIVENKKGWQRMPTLLNVISQPTSIWASHKSIFINPISA